MEKLYTKKEVAEILHCSVATIHRRITTGELKAIKNGRIVRITESELENFISKSDTQATESRPHWSGISGKQKSWT